MTDALPFVLCHKCYMQFESGSKLGGDEFPPSHFLIIYHVVAYNPYLPWYQLNCFNTVECVNSALSQAHKTKHELQ